MQDEATVTPVPKFSSSQAGTNRVLFLTTAQSYRADAFLEAARYMEVEAILAIDMDSELATTGKHGWGLSFADIDASLLQIRRVHQLSPLKAIIALDDAGALLAAKASAVLGLPHNTPAAAVAARDKNVMRQKLVSHSLNCPRFIRVTAQDSVSEVATEIGYPIVIKPLNLNGSQGVMRIDSEAELPSKVQRLQSILQPYPGSPPSDFLMESYIPGDEFAVEAIIVDNQLEILAIFDKPDPLEGPFFEESLYVTPSRLPASVQKEIGEVTWQATQALGLGFGPVHAELRINNRGLWILEVAGRSIGGLCSNTLHFGAGDSLETLILKHACGMPVQNVATNSQARGVMMIPIPQAGIFRGVDGVDLALQVPGITSVEITAVEGYSLKPLPEGNSYLGFIFAEGADPATVEQALRLSYKQLEIRMMPEFELAVPD